MRVPLEWLKEFVPIRIKPEALAERLTMAGLEVTGIEDTPFGAVLELEITPNRADCLSIIGVAREVAAMTGTPLAPPTAGKTRRKAPEVSLRQLRVKPVVRIEDHAGCSRYLGRLFENVQVSPSPDWMQRRLSACGIRAINNVVDITNYVLLEYGQPLHAFDFDRLTDGTILVRRARADEMLVTLDGARTTLRPEMLVIADAKAAVAVAGVMGGETSAVSAQTRRVLLESAWFDPLTVRRTARALGVMTESSYRFERGVDPAGVASASARAAQLIAELASGWEGPVCDVGRQPPARTTVALHVDRASRWLGIPVSSAAARTSLARLGCHVATAGSEATLHVTVPSYRADLRTDVDLYEELARATGYDRIPAVLLAPVVSASVSDEDALGYQRLQSLRCVCASLGLTETMSWSLVSDSDLARFGFPAAKAVRIANPLSQDHAFLQPSLLIGLAHAARRNLSQGASGLRLFEVGRTTTPHAAQPAERTSLGLALSGVWARDWRGTQPADFFQLKGVVETLVARLCEGPLCVEPGVAPWAEPQQAVALSIGGEPIGIAGRLSHAIAHDLNCEQEVWLAELSVEALLRMRRPRPAIQTPSAFPPVKRDLSFYVSDAHAYGQVAAAIREAAGSPAHHVELIDRYAGTQVPAGHHSLTFSIEYRDSSRTLTAEEADTLYRRVGQTLVERFGAHLR